MILAVFLVPALGRVSWCQQPTNVEKLKRVATAGFKDPNNAWAWSMQWFNHQLYVGTGRSVFCMTLLTSDVQNGTQVYPIGVAAGWCPQDPTHLSLQAEIWQYTPETHKWVRVFQSPNGPTNGGIPIGNDAQGNPVFTARDAGFRGMTVFTESDGTQALYVGGVTSGSAFDHTAPWIANPDSYPPPRILRTTDGVNWQPIPQDPGTFLGNIGAPFPGSTAKHRTFRALTPYKGKLYATVGTYQGWGSIVASSNPSAGNNAWAQVSPAPELFPAWNLAVFNNFLYCTIGSNSAQANNLGYGVFKTDGTLIPDPQTGLPFLAFTPIIQNAAGQLSAEAPSSAISIQEFRDHLYVGTGVHLPSELVRIAADDSYELIAADPHPNPQGVLLSPLSGLSAGLGNFFNFHFWRMATHTLLVNNVETTRLYLGTYDFSFQITLLPQLNGLGSYQYGADFFRSDDGFHWTLLSQNGFGNPAQYGIRSLQDTPLGLFIGTATPTGQGNPSTACTNCGFQVWLNQDSLDLNGDGVIDQNDVNIIMNALNMPATGPNDPRDLDQDGQITVLDARKLVTQCTLPGCAIPSTLPPPPVPPPQVTSASSQISNNQVILTWQPSPGAAQYNIFRATATPLLSLLPPGTTSITIPGLGITVTIAQIQSGALNSLCNENTEATFGLCALIEAVQSDSFVPGPFKKIVTTTKLFFSEKAPSTAQSMYYVQAVDSLGHTSIPSNLVGGPSFAAPFTFTAATTQIQQLLGSGLIDPTLASSLNQTLAQAATDAQNNDLTDSFSLVVGAQNTVQNSTFPLHSGDDLNYLLQGLRDSIQLAENSLIPVSALM